MTCGWKDVVWLERSICLNVWKCRFLLVRREKEVVPRAAAPTRVSALIRSGRRFAESSAYAQASSEGSALLRAWTLDTNAAFMLLNHFLSITFIFFSYCRLLLRVLMGSLPPLKTDSSYAVLC